MGSSPALMTEFVSSSHNINNNNNNSMNSISSSGSIGGNLSSVGGMRKSESSSTMGVENQLLKTEIAALNQEMSQALSRAKMAEKGERGN